MRELRVACVDQPDWLRGGHVPSLDGLRGASIILVLAAHLLPSQLSFAGNLGVDLFFIISGFIITLLLLREQERTGTLSLKNFYVRRALRILPAYGAFLLGAFTLSRFGLLAIAPRDWVPALTYTVGFLRVPEVLHHLWSLSTEEHFYLLWPVVLYLLPRRVALLGIGLCIALTPAVRVLVQLYFSGIVDVNLSTPTRMDGIAAGCFLAFLAWSPSRPRGLWPLSWRADIVAGTSVLACAVSCYLLKTVAGAECYRAFYHSCCILCLSVIVWVGVYRPSGLVGRPLNSRLAIRAGLLSYSLYLWQQPFCFSKADYWIFRWPLNLCAAVACALISYYLIEVPFLWLRNSWRAANTKKPFPFSLHISSHRPVPAEASEERPSCRQAG
jgi:peptidoglycan/LPS O-acetylase OafA/YrhL